MDPKPTIQTSAKAAVPSGNSQGNAAPLSTDELRKLDAYWRASNYLLASGKNYLPSPTPFLRELPLA